MGIAHYKKQDFKHGPNKKWYKELQKEILWCQYPYWHFDLVNTLYFLYLVINNVFVRYTAIEVKHRWVV